MRIALKNIQYICIIVFSVILFGLFGRTSQIYAANAPSGTCVCKDDGNGIGVVDDSQNLCVPKGAATCRNNGRDLEGNPVYSCSCDQAIQEYDECGATLAEYMNDLIDAKARGEIPSNVKLLSPAFNMTSDTFSGIVGEMVNANANFAGLDGIAGNVYNTPGVLMTYYMEARIVPVIGGFGKSLYITETGAMMNINDANVYDGVKLELENINNHGIRVNAALLFDALGTNGDPNFAKHVFRDNGKLGELLSRMGGRGGINFATFYTSGNYGQASSLGSKWTLEISRCDDAGATIDGLNAALPGMTPIIRVGVGNDSGGCNPVGNYINFLNQVGNAVGGRTIYAIAGPNEPDAEGWLSSCGKWGGMGNSCALIDDIIEPVRYKPEIIGISMPPFVLSGSLKDTEGRSAGKPGSAYDQGGKGDLASYIKANLKLSVVWSEYPDLRPMETQILGIPNDKVEAGVPGYIGSNPVTDLPDQQPYIRTLFDVNKRTAGAVILEDDNGNKAWEENAKYTHPPAHLITRTKEESFNPSFTTVTKQAKKGNESYDTFTRRLFPSEVTDNYGKITDLVLEDDPLKFNGCIQSYPCDPKVQECLKLQYNFDPYGSSNNTKCADSDNPMECISYGNLVTFENTNNASLPEKSEPYALSRAYYDVWSKLVKLPGESGRWDEGMIGGYKGNTNLASKSPTPLIDTNVASKTSVSTLKSPPPVHADASDITYCEDEDGVPTIGGTSCFPGCVANPDGSLKSCYGLPYQKPWWQPVLTFKCDSSGQNCVPTYVLKMFKEYPCGLHHYGAYVSGYNVRTGEGGSGAFSHGDGRRNQDEATYGPGMGKEGVLVLPGFDNVSMSPGDCFVMNVKVEGFRQGPQKQCSGDNGIPQVLSASCQICLDSSGSPDPTKSNCKGVMPKSPPIDCRVCNSWAPAEFCSGVDGHKVKKVHYCGGPECETGLIQLNPGDDIDFTQVDVDPDASYGRGSRGKEVVFDPGQAGEAEKKPGIGDPQYYFGNGPGGDRAEVPGENIELGLCGPSAGEDGKFKDAALWALPFCDPYRDEYFNVSCSSWDRCFEWGSGWSCNGNEIDPASRPGCLVHDGSCCDGTWEREPSGCILTKTRYQCAFANKKYFVYAYPVNLIGKMNMYRNDDMGIHNALFEIPGITDEYFETESALAPLKVEISVADTGGDYEVELGRLGNGVPNEAKDKAGEPNKGSTVAIGVDALKSVNVDGKDGEEDCKGGVTQTVDGRYRDSPSKCEGQNSFALLNPQKNLSDRQRIIQVEYFNIYNPQITGHCLKNAFLSLPGEFPASQAELCSYVDGLDVTALGNSTLSNANSNGVQNGQGGASSEGGFEAAPALAAPPADAAGSEAGVSSPPESSLVPPAPVDKEIIKQRFLRDLEKLLEKYGDQIKTKNPTMEDLPPEMLKELNELSKKYKEQYDL